MKLKVINIDGNSTKDIEILDSIFSLKPNNKLKDTNSKNIEKEKSIVIETEDIQTEVREIKSSSPIEVTQIDENTSSKKPKKKGWWS